MECNNCGQSDFRTFIKTNCYWSRIPLNVVTCKNCGLVFLNPRPDKNLGVEYFEKAYSNAEGFKDHTYYRDNELIFNRNKQRFEILKKINAPSLNVLDFGAGQGHFIKICNENKWTATGTELSLAAIKAANELFGIELFNNMDNFKTSFFGVITMWDVIEHLENPREVLINLRKYLQEGGFLIIETSNINSYDFHINRKKWSYWHIDHYYYFSDQTLADLLENIGFEIVNLKQDQIQEVAKKKRDFKKFLVINNYIRTLQMLYYKYTIKGISNSSLMTIIARKG